MPPQVPLAVAQSVLFVGKAVRILRNYSSGTASEELLPPEDELAFSTALQQLQQCSEFDQLAFEAVVEGIRRKVGGREVSLLQ